MKVAKLNALAAPRPEERNQLLERCGRLEAGSSRLILSNPPVGFDGPK
jgi:hypothetical protein